MKLKTEQVVIDNAIYPRSSPNEFIITRMMTALDAGATFPPMVVESGSNRLIDGRHRYEVYRRKGIKSFDVVAKSYPSEAELFADAVRLNVEHGQALTAYDVRSAVARLSEMGYARDKISAAVRIPEAKIEEITRGFAQTPAGEPVALKGGLRHLRGQSLSDRQREAQRHYGGHSGLFYVRQIAALIDNDMWPRQSEAFAQEMDALVASWAAMRTGEAA